MRKTLFAVGTALALAASVPTVASAQRFGHWGGWHGGWHHGFFGHRAFFGPRFGFRFGVAPYAYAACGVHRVWTPFGWRWRRFC